MVWYLFSILWESLWFCSVSSGFTATVNEHGMLEGFSSPDIVFVVMYI